MAARLYYMDNLRAFAMLLGIFFHASLAYAPPLNQFWFINDANDSSLLSAFAWGSHAFRMPLFFLIAGYFGSLLTHKRGVGNYIRNRLLRVGAPFLMFLPLLALASFGVIGFALHHVDEPSRMLLFLQERLDNSMSETGSASKIGDVGTLHLWFLYYLLFFSLIAAGLSRLRIKWLKRLLSPLTSSLWTIALAPLLLAPALFLAGAPTPSPDRLMIKLWPFGYFGLFFAFGWRLYGAEDFLKRIEGAWPFFLAAAAWCLLVYHLLMPALAYPPEPLEFSRRVTLSILQSYVAALSVVGFLSLGRRCFDIESPGVRYVADASYWLYIVHLPLVVLMQTMLANIDLNVWLKFLLSSLLPIMAGLAAYALFVRNTPIGVLLNGVRKRGMRKRPAQA